METQEASFALVFEGSESASARAMDEHTYLQYFNIIL